MNVSGPNGSSTILKAMATNGLSGSGVERRSLASGSSWCLALTGAVQRRGQVADDGVQQRLHALVAIGRAQEHRRELLTAARPRATTLWISSSATASSASSSSISSSLYIESASSMCCRAACGLVGQLGRNRLVADVLAVGAVEVDAPSSSTRSITPSKFVFAADGNLHQHGVAAQLLAQLLDDLLRDRRRCGPSC